MKYVSNMRREFITGISIVAVLSFLTVFTSCSGLAGGNDKPGDSNNDYTEKISNLTYSTNQDTITFRWTNPSSQDFCGVRIYLDAKLIVTLEKDITEYTLDYLNFDSSSTFTFKVCRLNADGKEEESVNPVTKTIQLGKISSKWGFIGKGYDAINGEYFCYSDGLKNQILQFNENFRLSRTSVNNSSTSYYFGKTFSSYRKDFSEAIGISGGYAGFSGSFNTSVGFSNSYSEEMSFATATSTNIKVKESLDASQMNLAVLKQNLTPEFKAAVNNSSISPEDLFKTYGTHVMLETDIGGRFVVNYEYENTEGEDTSTFSLSVEANYDGLFSAGASSNTGFDKNSKMTTTNTKISGYTRGGSGAAFSNMDNAIESMRDWTASLDDESKWSLIDSTSTIAKQDVCTGVWMFADSEERKNEIRSKYMELLAQNENSIASVQTSKWIKNIYLYDSDVSGKKTFKEMKELLKGKIPNAEIKFAGENSAEMTELQNTYSGSTLESKQDEYIKQFDLMKGAGGNFVYMIFEYTTNKDEALRGVYGNSSGKMSNTTNINYRYEEKDSSVQYDANLWSIVRPIDSDDDDYCAGDKSRVIFKSYKQNRDGTTGEKAYPIKEIAIYNKNTGKTSASSMTSRWKLSSEGDFIDIAKDAGGDEIFLRIYYDPEDIK